MSTNQILLVAVLVLSMLCALLVYMVARLVNEMNWLREDVATAKDIEHAKCIGAVAAYVGNEWAAQVLDVAAADYESAESHADLDRIGRLLYKPGGPPVPAIWLRERADKARIDADWIRETEPVEVGA